MNQKYPHGAVEADVHDLANRLRVLCSSAPRTIIGLCGAPGAGKSTLAARIVAELGTATAAVVPMDGFHLANRVLADLGLADRKGAPETFDVHGYAATLARLAERSDPVVYAPEFRRELEESFAGALRVSRDTPLVITEGNYLLLPTGGWPRARAHVDEVWYLDVHGETRRQRLMDRHRRHGRTEKEAAAWVEQVDEPNARAIANTAKYADCRVKLITDSPPPSSGRW